MNYLQIEGEAPQIAAPVDARHMIIGSGPTEDSLKTNACLVRLHDLLPPVPNSNDERMFLSWMKASRDNRTPMLEHHPRHWCDVNDVVPAIIELLKGETEATVYNLAGRRTWTVKATWEEFDALFQRTNAGKTGRFEFEHLEAKGIPSVAVVEVGAVEQAPQRPSLTTTHAFLEAKTGEGWRPTTPLRRSLMVVIANLDEAYSS
jgi:nucleoside-diphosphate-sugar epimerase